MEVHAGQSYILNVGITPWTTGIILSRVLNGGIATYGIGYSSNGMATGSQQTVIGTQKNMSTNSILSISQPMTNQSYSHTSQSKIVEIPISSNSNIWNGQILSSYSSSQSQSQSQPKGTVLPVAYQYPISNMPAQQFIFNNGKSVSQVSNNVNNVQNSQILSQS